MDHMDLTSSTLLAIICKRDTELVVMALTKHHPTEDTILTIVMTPTMVNLPTEDTNLIMAMTLTKNHPMYTILTTVMTRTNHHLTDMILISHHTMNMKNLMRNHLNQSMKTSHLNQSMKTSHTNQNMSLSHTIIMKPLITIPMSPMIITQSLSMSITKNIPIHLPNTSMATNHLGMRNMAAVIIITKNHMGVTK